MRELVGGKNTIGRKAAVLKSPIKRPLPLPLPLKSNLVVVLKYYFIIIEVSIPNVYYTTHYKAIYFIARKLYVTAQRITLAGYSAYLALLAVIYT